MKARTIALFVLVIAVTVAAQTTPPSQKVAPAAKPAATQAKPAATPATPPATAKPAQATKPAAKAAAPAAKPAKTAAKAAQPAATKTAKAAKPAKPAATKTAKAAKPAKPAAVKEAAPRKTSTTAKAKRDPFLSPVVRADGPMGCATGKKCLPIAGIVLKGIVKSQVGMIAVVESPSRHLSYFLRENDPVFNGYVVKITRDSVVFRENIMDPLGRQSTREVVKTVIAPVV